MRKLEPFRTSHILRMAIALMEMPAQKGSMTEPLLAAKVDSDAYRMGGGAGVGGGSARMSLKGEAARDSIDPAAGRPEPFRKTNPFGCAAVLLFRRSRLAMV